MLVNQLMAKIKLQNKKTCALHYSVGHSWFQALEPEFQKEYFSKVSQTFYYLLNIDNNSLLFYIFNLCS